MSAALGMGRGLLRWRARFTIFLWIGILNRSLGVPLVRHRFRQPRCDIGDVEDERSAVGQGMLLSCLTYVDMRIVARDVGDDRGSKGRLSVGSRAVRLVWHGSLRSVMTCAERRAVLAPVIVRTGCIVCLGDPSRPDGLCQFLY